MNVAVVICAYTLERWDQLSEAVASCEDQSLPPDQVVVVIDHNDELYERAAARSRRPAYQEPLDQGPLRCAQHRRRATTGDAVAFLDDDARADPDWLDSSASR